jgi:hypothetical protein
MPQSIKVLPATKENRRKQQAFNFWQADVTKKQFRGTHENARPFLPMEINGRVVMRCPDTGVIKEIPKQVINAYSKYN